MAQEGEKGTPSSNKSRVCFNLGVYGEQESVVGVFQQSYVEEDTHQEGNIAVYILADEP
jgi:hypothetical protein